MTVGKWLVNLSFDMKYILVLLFVISEVAYSQKLEGISIDGANKFAIEVIDGQIFYNLERNGEELISSSRMGLSVSNWTNEEDWEIVDSSTSKHSSEWKPIWGKTSSVKDEYIQLILSLQKTANPHQQLNIESRIYNDGVAWRYDISAQSGDSISIEEDLTTFNFPKKGIWWSFNGERKNLGPREISNMPDTLHTPFLYKSQKGKFIAILEAEIKNMAYFDLIKSAENPEGLRCSMLASAIKIPVKTSWRVIMTGDSEKQLIESNLMVNLNPPSKIENTAWIKPGISTWNWRGWGYKTADGYEYELNTDAQKKFIDFAAKNGFEYHLIDANWYGPEFDEASDPSTPKADFNVQEVLSYAKEKKVGVFLYLNDVGAKKFGLERVLSQFHDWGAAGIKYGFMKGEGQEKVLHTRRVIELCAKNELMIIFHDNPIPPSGDHRTWPNLLAREYGHAQADGKYSVFPDSSINQVFINMLGGPLDMNFGWFDLHEAKDRKKVQEPVPGTVVGEMARVAAIFSGFVCIPDVPEEYVAKPELLEFLQRLPSKFDDYKVLQAKIDQYLSVMRRSQDIYVIASYTNNETRQIDIALDFLDKGKRYTAYIYKDAKDSNYLTNKEGYEVENRIVSNTDTIKASLAAGGGHCMILEKID